MTRLLFQPKPSSSDDELLSNGIDRNKVSPSKRLQNSLISRIGHFVGSEPVQDDLLEACVHSSPHLLSN